MHGTLNHCRIHCGDSRPAYEDPQTVSGPRLDLENTSLFPLFSLHPITLPKRKGFGHLLPLLLLERRGGGKRSLVSTLLHILVWQLWGVHSVKYLNHSYQGSLVDPSTVSHTPLPTPIFFPCSSFRAQD